MLIKLSINQMLFNAIFVFSNLFINAYLFKESREISTVALYNFYMFLFWGIFFYIGFRCCEKNTRIGQTLSGVSSTIGVFLLILDINSVLLLGLCMGATGGFFWTSYLSIYRSLGKNSQSGGTFAKVSLLATVVTIFIPILFGYLVEGSGYMSGFIVLLILSLAIIIMSFFMPKLKTERIKFTKNSFSKTGFNIVGILQGFYFSFVNIATGLLVYMAGISEATLGAFATYYGVVAVIVTITMAYFIPSKYQKKVLFLTSIIYIVSSCVLWNDWSYSIILYNFILSFIGPLFLNTLMGKNFTYIGQQFKNGEEGLLMRELSMTVGRLLFFAYMAVFGLNASSISFYIFLLIASIFPFIIYKIISNWTEEKDA